MTNLYNPTISKRTKRQPQRMVGYYTTPEAAEQLGVDPATLRYRRDSADAKAYWDLLGVTANDDINELLARSHTIYNGHHYYEQKKFDKFVKLYLKRPEVIRARKRFTTFPTTHTELLTHTITNNEDIEKIKYVIDRMFKAEVKNLTVTLSVTP